MIVTSVTKVTTAATKTDGAPTPTSTTAVNRHALWRCPDTSGLHQPSTLQRRPRVLV